LLLAFSCFAAFTASVIMAETAISRSINSFAVDFVKNVSPKEDNVFFSSASISTAFAMLAAGSRGATEDQLKTTFKLNELDDVNEQFSNLMTILKPRAQTNETYELNMANKLVLSSNDHVRDEYKSIIVNKFKATVDEYDFSRDAARAVQEINQWVSDETRGMIDYVLDDLDPLTKLVILNAIYFKGAWKVPFEKEATHQDTFFGSVENQVDFMTKKDDIRALKDDDKKFTALELPYVGNASMVIFLPDEKNGIEQLVQSLTSSEIERVINDLSQTAAVESDLYLPKFKVETEYDLKSILVELGVSHVFSPFNADLTGISSHGGLHVSKAIHKAVVDVDEEGTKAAAVTAIVMESYSIRIDPLYRVDRPFLFFIRDNVSGINLFTGKIAKL